MDVQVRVRFRPQDRPPARRKPRTYHQNPDSISALSWDTYNILLDAIEKAGSTDPEKIRAELEVSLNPYSRSHLGVTSDVRSAWVISKIENGKFVYVTTVAENSQAKGNGVSDYAPWEIDGE